MTVLRFGREVCGSLAEASAREWLVADGVGGFAMGTVGGLRTRRYHGLLVVADGPSMGRRHLGLAAIDPVVVVGDRRLRLAVHEWDSGAVDPDGHVHLESFELLDGVPTWRWSIGPVVLERQVAASHGRPAVGIVHRLVRSPLPVRVELGALCTWRDVHGERHAGADPNVEHGPDGFVFESAYRVSGPGWRSAGEWYRGVRYREEAARGLPAVEDLWHPGDFGSNLAPGEAVEVVAWVAPNTARPPSATSLVADAQSRAREIGARCRPLDDADRTLAHAADQLIVAGPAVVAGYPWFGEWSRDTFTSYEGLFLETGRHEEGRTLLTRAAATLSAGMLANTADSGVAEYNTADATLWFVHALSRHVDRTGDIALIGEMDAALEEILAAHRSGTRHGIHVATDGLLAQGEAGLALTWMDARVDGVPVTARSGKAVEVNALWVNALAAIVALGTRVGRRRNDVAALHTAALGSFRRRFGAPLGLYDVIDGPRSDDAVRPNQLLAISLPDGPLRGDPRARGVVDLCRRDLLTSLGLRSLTPRHRDYRGRHLGGPADRDRAYHQGTVWPWLIGAYVDAAHVTGLPTTGVLDALETHLGEWGLGSISETTDGDPPHAASGCPFQAWSVAEVLRARRCVAAHVNGAVTN
jgi:predicted glycogen debranching enzyme